MDLESIATDIDAKENGKWFTYNGGTGEPLELLIRSMGSKAYQDAFDDAVKPYKKMLAVGGKIPEKRDKELTIRLQSHVLVLDWKNMTMKKQDVPFSADLLNTILSDDENQKLRRFINACAAELDNFDKAVEAIVEGN